MFGWLLLGGLVGYVALKGASVTFYPPAELPPPAPPKPTMRQMADQMAKRTEEIRQWGREHGVAE